MEMFKLTKEQIVELEKAANKMAKAMEKVRFSFAKKPEFKKEQWVVGYSKTYKKEIVRKIVAVYEDTGYATLDQEYLVISFDQLRHATESEIAQEKERRTDKKLDKLLLDLSNEERVRLAKKLDGDHE
ncbi:hypothetical protein GCM10011409_45950 [Lentibacillus populi]|uniref:Uncharacterized protein n=1 Tax=Lentibacillus populi TaxID=1827502 RepID=A0A9W5U2V8_9BACI|nr:hypothetical protein [Lentibacillus populi]GGB63700.1 hypothetical protein GCM10011409_45950 [Lentibacillus populi]